MTVARPRGDHGDPDGTVWRPFEAVLAAARLGDPVALTELWERYAPGVLAFARSRGASEPDEVTSDCFLAAYTKLREFEGGESEFRALLYTVAHRRVVDDARRRSVRIQSVTLPGDYEGEVHASEPSAEEHVVRRHADLGAWRMLAELSTDQREVLALRIFGDLTLEQTAVVLGKRTGAVKALQRRGLATLRRRMDNEDGKEAEG